MFARGYVHVLADVEAEPLQLTLRVLQHVLQMRRKGDLKGVNNISGQIKKWSNNCQMCSMLYGAAGRRPANREIEGVSGHTNGAEGPKRTGVIGQLIKNNGQVMVSMARLSREPRASGLRHAPCVRARVRARLSVHARACV